MSKIALVLFAVVLLTAVLLTAGLTGCTNFESRSGFRPIGPPPQRADPDLADDTGDFRGDYWTENWQWDRDTRQWKRR